MSIRKADALTYRKFTATRRKLPWQPEVRVDGTIYASSEYPTQQPPDQDSASVQFTLCVRESVLGLSERRPVPHAGGPARHLGSLISGAACPANTRPFNPNPDTDELKSWRYKSAEHNPLPAQNQAIISAFQE